MEDVLQQVRAAAEAAARGPTGSFADVPAEARAAWASFIAIFTPHGVPAAAIDREAMGRLVREVWVAFARRQPNPKPSWLEPWEALTEPEREVDRCIGETLGTYTLAMMASSLVYLPEETLAQVRALLTRVETRAQADTIL